MDKEYHRVHFDESKDVVGKENEILVQKNGNALDVHLGFLQVNHRYAISFPIPRSICEKECESQVIPNEQSSCNPHLKINKIEESKDQITFHMELFTHKEQLMVEEQTLRLSDGKEPIRVVLNARVLGKGKGTPLLKNGIHVIHGPVEYDSDASSDFPDNN